MRTDPDLRAESGKNDSSELSPEHGTAESKAQRTGQENYVTLLKATLLQVL